MRDRKRRRWKPLPKSKSLDFSGVSMSSPDSTPNSVGRLARQAGQGCGGGEDVAGGIALSVVERWNAERSVLWSPTIRCAIVAGTPWLDIYCPGCRTSRAIDIRTLDRHPLASVGSLVLGLRCSWCPGIAPMPVLTGLHALPPAARWRRSMPVEFLHGRPLSPEDLEMIRQQIEEGFDNIAEVDPEIRSIVARNWPHLLAKLPPEED
jgi:hypothetical protein